VGWAKPNPKQSFRPPFSKGGGVLGQSPGWVWAKPNFFFTIIFSNKAADTGAFSLKKQNQVA